MTGPRYALEEAVRLGWRHATVVARTIAGDGERVYDLRVAGVLMTNIPEDRIRPLVANDSEAK